MKQLLAIILGNFEIRIFSAVVDHVDYKVSLNQPNQPGV